MIGAGYGIYGYPMFYGCLTLDGGIGLSLIPAVRPWVAPSEGWGYGHRWHICREARPGGRGLPSAAVDPWPGRRLAAER